MKLETQKSPKGPADRLTRSQQLGEYQRHKGKDKVVWASGQDLEGQLPLFIC